MFQCPKLNLLSVVSTNSQQLESRVTGGDTFCLRYSYSSITPCCGSKTPKFRSLSTRRRVYCLFTVPHLTTSFCPSVSYNQIIGMDLVESEQIVSSALQPAHTKT